jgi:hypothetical protein
MYNKVFDMVESEMLYTVGLGLILLLFEDLFSGNRWLHWQSIVDFSTSQVLLRLGSQQLLGLPFFTIRFLSRVNNGGFRLLLTWHIY